MIPFAEWSRNQAGNRRSPIAAEAKSLSILNDAAIDPVEVPEILVLLSFSIQESARLEQIDRMRKETHTACVDLLDQFARAVQSAAAGEAENLSAQLNCALRPWIGIRIAEKAVAAFAEEVGLAFGRKLASDVVIEVPEPLRKVAQARFQELGMIVSFAISPDAELHAIQGNTQVNSTNSLWQEKLANLLP